MLAWTVPRTRFGIALLAILVVGLLYFVGTRPGAESAEPPTIAFVGDGEIPLDGEQRSRLGVERLPADEATAATIEDTGAWVVMFDGAAAGELPAGRVRDWYESGLVVMGLEMTTANLMELARAYPDEALADLQPPADAGFVVDAGPISGTDVLPDFDGPSAAYIARTATETFAEVRCFRKGRGYFEFEEPLFTAKLNTKRGIGEGRLSFFDGTMGRLACSK